MSELLSDELRKVIRFAAIHPGAAGLWNGLVDTSAELRAALGVEVAGSTLSSGELPLGPGEPPTLSDDVQLVLRMAMTTAVRTGSAGVEIRHLVGALAKVAPDDLRHDFSVAGIDIEAVARRLGAPDPDLFVSGVDAEAAPKEAVAGGRVTIPAGRARLYRIEQLHGSVAFAKELITREVPLQEALKARGVDVPTATPTADVDIDTSGEPPAPGPVEARSISVAMSRGGTTVELADTLRAFAELPDNPGSVWLRSIGLDRPMLLEIAGPG